MGKGGEVEGRGEGLSGSVVGVEAEDLGDGGVGVGLDSDASASDLITLNISV